MLAWVGVGDPTNSMGLLEKTKDLSKYQRSSRYFLSPKFSTQTEHFPFRTRRPLECAIQKLLSTVRYDFPAKKILVTLRMWSFQLLNLFRFSEMCLTAPWTTPKVTRLKLKSRNSYLKTNPTLTITHTVSTEFSVFWVLSCYTLIPWSSRSPSCFILSMAPGSHWMRTELRLLHFQRWSSLVSSLVSRERSWGIYPTLRLSHV